MSCCHGNKQITVMMVNNVKLGSVPLLMTFASQFGQINDIHPHMSIPEMLQKLHEPCHEALPPSSAVPC